MCGDQLIDGRCDRCARFDIYYDQVVALGNYHHHLGVIVRAIKYYRNQGLGFCLLESNLKVIDNLDFDMIVPVPLGRKRRKQRGFNQAEVIARPIALAMGMEYVPKAVCRIRETRSQVELNIKERIENVKKAFLARSDIVKDRKVLLVDDVITTGATINDCARALKDAGAARVVVFVLARVNGRTDTPVYLKIQTRGEI